MSILSCTFVIKLHVRSNFIEKKRKTKDRLKTNVTNLMLITKDENRTLEANRKTQRLFGTRITCTRRHGFFCKIVKARVRLEIPGKCSSPTTKEFEPTCEALDPISSCNIPYLAATLGYTSLRSTE